MFFDKLFGTDRPAPPQTDNVKLLTTVHSPEERAVIESVLRSAEIPYLARERGAGEVVRIVMGSNATLGCDIYVDEEKFEEAIELISFEEIDDEEPEEGSEEL
ncbi:MAG: hypothetical protein IJZ89_04405 [Clostridia bacterium]|nr:hypothetical protein [Clostridia bacterium]